MIRDLLISWLLGRTVGIKDFFFFNLPVEYVICSRKGYGSFFVFFLHFIIFLKKFKIFLTIFYFKLIFFYVCKLF